MVRKWRWMAVAIKGMEVEILETNKRMNCWRVRLHFFFSPLEECFALCEFSTRFAFNLFDALSFTVCFSLSLSPSLSLYV